MKHLNSVFSASAWVGVVLFALTGLFSCAPEDEEEKGYSERASQDKLAVSPAEQIIAQDGSASFTFTFTLISERGKTIDLKETKTAATIKFEATGGSVSPASATTDEKGQVTVTFTTPDPEGFTGGTVKGIVKKVDGIVFQQGDLATATATVLPLGSVTPPDPPVDDPPVVAVEPIKKAEDLKDNTYSVQKGDGEAQVFDLPQEYSQWYVGRSSMDKTREAIKVEVMDEDPVQSTMGWGMFELPTEIANKLTTINQEFNQKYPWAAAKFGTFRLGKEVTVHLGQGGNVRLDGSSQIWLKEKAGTKAYSGQYQLLFIFVIDNQSWDSATQTYIPDGEYTVIGNAILEEYFPTLSWFRIEPEKDWVKVGDSVKVDAEWDDGASFDWSKVKLVGQEKGYGSSDDVDEGYFSWDASSHTLKALKSSDNVNVYLKFRYEGTEMATSCQIATGPGWDYTSFSFNPARLVMDKYDAMYLNVDQFAPTNLTWDWTAIEIDPETNPNEAFYYDRNIHKLYNFSAKADQTYNLRFRIRSNYSVGAPLEVYVVDEKPYSFEITYEQDGVYKPWSNGSPDGICNYGMGLPLGVKTSPEDCYWNWADVELMPGYDNTFSFSGHGGRDDHPKLMLKTSHDGTNYGVQVGFRLKYDHSKTSYIYVTHN